MAEQKTQSPVYRYEDAPEILDTYADAIGQWYFDGHTLRIEFLVSRLDEPQGKTAASTGCRRPVSRIALSAAGAVDMINRFQQLSAVLEKAGMLKRVGKGTATGSS